MDLFVKIEVREHEFFERKGPHLLIEKDVDAVDILLEKEIEIETISGGKEKVSLPKEILFGEPIRLKGQGIAGARSPMAISAMRSVLRAVSGVSGVFTRR